MKAKTLRLILGDQLDIEHSWFKTVDTNVTYLIAELHQEQLYVKHHIQKVCAFFLAMESFSKKLQTEGHRVIYYTLDHTIDESLADLIVRVYRENQFSLFEYQHPDEYRLLKQLRSLESDHSIPTLEKSSEHFLLPQQAITEYFLPEKHNRMETFYRKMRKKFNILMEDGQPIGGKWNYDASNRAKLKADDLDRIPAPLVFSTDAKTTVDRIKRHGIKVLGIDKDTIAWPVNREESLKLLQFFCKSCLPQFGQFQDAMTENSLHSWSLYHSRLSFSLNCKLISPIEVIDSAISAFKQRPQSISIEQIEGFVRQVIGWREYMRGIYWINQPNYSKQNFFNAIEPLPSWFWTGDTRMSCLRSAILQSLEHSYAHHIQRLMVTGNFCLIAGIDPDCTEEWYLGIYIDAIEWVEQPNTRGMALFADGGWIATKPYAASGNYINKMSDHCKGCSYSPKKKLEEDACPLNSLYWHFLDKNREVLRSNPRMAFPYKALERMSGDDIKAINKKAKTVLDNIESI